MIIKIKKSSLKIASLALIVCLLSISFIISLSFNSSYAAVTNITNVSVVARLNITNSPLNITEVTLNDDDATTPEIDLIANNVRVVTCNATVFDFDGWQDVDANKTNATLFIQSVGLNAADDNNNHYTNSTCGRCVQIDSTNAGCDCRFAVQYYANDSSEWICNLSTSDRGGSGGASSFVNFSDSEISSATTITKLLAIDTPTTILDYGNLSVTQVSAAVARNITNVGNINLNFTVRGFGGENGSVTNDNFTMICDFGNISFGNHRYAVGLNTSFGNMRNLTNQTVDTNFTLPQRVNDNSAGDRIDINETFWRLEIPLDVGGLCNGTIIFGAVESNNSI